MLDVVLSAQKFSCSNRLLHDSQNPAWMHACYALPNQRKLYFTVHYFNISLSLMIFPLIFYQFVLFLTLFSWPKRLHSLKILLPAHSIPLFKGLLNNAMMPFKNCCVGSGKLCSYYFLHLNVKWLVFTGQEKKYCTWRNSF